MTWYTILSTFLALCMVGFAIWLILIHRQQMRIWDKFVDDWSELSDEWNRTVDKIVEKGSDNDSRME